MLNVKKFVTALILGLVLSLSLLVASASAHTINSHVVTHNAHAAVHTIARWGGWGWGWGWGDCDCDWGCGWGWGW